MAHWKVFHLMRELKDASGNIVTVETLAPPPNNEIAGSITEGTEDDSTIPTPPRPENHLFPHELIMKIAWYTAYSDGNNYGYIGRRRLPKAFFSLRKISRSFDAAVVEVFQSIVKTGEFEHYGAIFLPSRSNDFGRLIKLFAPRLQPSSPSKTAASFVDCVREIILVVQPIYFDLIDDEPKRAQADLDDWIFHGLAIEDRATGNVLIDLPYETGLISQRAEIASVAHATYIHQHHEQEGFIKSQRDLSRFLRSVKRITSIRVEMRDFFFSQYSWYSYPYQNQTRRFNLPLSKLGYDKSMSQVVDILSSRNIKQLILHRVDGRMMNSLQILQSRTVQWFSTLVILDLSITTKSNGMDDPKADVLGKTLRSLKALDFLKISTAHNGETLEGEIILGDCGLSDSACLDTPNWIEEVLQGQVFTQLRCFVLQGYCVERRHIQEFLKTNNSVLEHITLDVFLYQNDWGELLLALRTDLSLQTASIRCDLRHWEGHAGVGEVIELGEANVYDSTIVPRVKELGGFITGNDMLGPEPPSKQDLLLNSESLTYDEAKSRESSEWKARRALHKDTVKGMERPYRPALQSFHDIA